MRPLNWHSFVRGTIRLRLLDGLADSAEVRGTDAALQRCDVSPVSSPAGRGRAAGPAGMKIDGAEERSACVVAVTRVQLQLRGCRAPLA